MSRLLYVAYHFPPIGGVNSLRNYKLAKYLHNHGWEVEVLSVEMAEWKRRSSLYDEGLLDEVRHVKIHRTKGVGERFLNGLPRKLHMNAKWLRAPDECIYWARLARSRAIQMIKEGEFDALLTTSYPTSSHLLGYWIKEKTGIPWIADLQDPWVRNYGIPFPSRFHKKREMKMESSVVKTTDLVLNVTRSLAEEMRSEYSNQPGDKFDVLHNGFDPEDFPGKGYGRKGNMTILFTGSLWKLDPSPVMEALCILGKTGRLDPALRLKFVGNTPRKWKEKAKNMGLENIVEFQDAVPHSTVPGMLETADCLLQILYRGEGKERILGGKLGEYLDSRRPILTVANKGELAEVMREANVGPIVEPENVEGIAKALHGLVEGWKRGETARPNEEVISRFNYKDTLAPRLASMLDKIVPR
ncbi:MAG: glycosyltransferase family 4 protein [Thermoplasmata archaeon]|nr:glycosyltransferase family 4 protein [Thermoplasmata archaeon]